MSGSERSSSDLSRAFREDGAHKTHIGGQALLEGIMMRGKLNWAVAAREPDGAIYTEEHDLASGRPRNSWMNAPLVRGCRALVESLVIGFKALEVAATHAYDEEGLSAADARKRAEDAAADDAKTCAAAGGTAPSAGNPGDGRMPASCANERGDFSWKDDFGRPDTVIDALGAQATLDVVTVLDEGAACKVDDADRNGADAGDALRSSASPDSPESDGDGFGKKEMAVSMVLGLVLGVVLFIVAPAAITNLIVGEYDDNVLLWNIVDGVLRVAVFVFYIWLIGRMSDIKRMFAYHGAEHKTIHCYEHGLPLTPENARSFPRLHVRCGTAFLIMVMIIAIFVYTVVPVNLLIEALGVPDGPLKLALVIAVRIVFLPVIAGISYEITVKWAGSHPDNPLVKVILWPGMQMQYLTTNEPDDGMLECAIAAMKLVVEREQVQADRTTSAKGLSREGGATAIA